MWHILVLYRCTHQHPNYYIRGSRSSTVQDGALSAPQCACSLSRPSNNRATCSGCVAFTPRVFGAQSKSITRKETTISTASSSCTHARHGTFHSELSSLFCCISVRGALPEPREGACCQGCCRTVAPSRSWFRGLYARLEMIFWSPHIATPPLLPHKFSAALPVPTTS